MFPNSGCTLVILRLPFSTAASSLPQPNTLGSRRCKTPGGPARGRGGPLRAGISLLAGSPGGNRGHSRGSRSPESAQPGQHVICVQPESLFLQCAAASGPEPPTLGGGRSPRAAAWRFLHASRQCLLCLFCPPVPVHLSHCHLVFCQRREGKVWGPPHPHSSPRSALASTPGSPALLQTRSSQSRKARAFRVHSCLVSCWEVVPARPRLGGPAGPREQTAPSGGSREERVHFHC